MLARCAGDNYFPMVDVLFKQQMQWAGVENSKDALLHVPDKDALFAEIFRVLAPNAHFYLFTDPETAFVAKPAAEMAGFKFWKPIIWDKQSIGMGYHYRARYEMILFFEKGKRRLNSLATPDVLSVARVRGGVVLSVVRAGPAARGSGLSLRPGRVGRHRGQGDRLRHPRGRRRGRRAGARRSRPVLRDGAPVARVQASRTR